MKQPYPFENRNSQEALNSKRKSQQAISPQIIDFQLEECDQLQEQGSQVSEKKEDLKTSFVSGFNSKQKKQKINKYLHQNRNSIPLTRRYRNSIDVADEGQYKVQIGDIEGELQSIQNVQQMNRQMEMFILAFNKKPETAIRQYINRGFIVQDQPEAIAKYILKVDGINKVVLGQYFGKNDKKVLLILHAYCNQLKFHKVQFDIAIRKLLSKFRLPGQAQQIQRVIWQFALSYYQQNKEDYANADELFPLAYAIIMLATDAHNPKQQKKMSAADFVKNTQGPCPSIEKKYLQNIYNRITKEKFETEINYLQTIYARLKDLDLPNIMQALNLSKQLQKGDIFLKVCRNTNKFVQRKLFLSQDQSKINWISDPPKSDQQQPRFILISDIKSLTLGIGSANMKKNKVPEEFDSLCFTITTNYRTLDLKARTTKQRSKWLNYLRAIMIRRRQQKKQLLENEQKKLINKQSLQEAWNTDIFSKWDQHWDYQLKKPKQKGYIARGIQAICCCWESNKQNVNQGHNTLGLHIKHNLLETLWKYGLPPSSRKTLWVQIIGNNLALNQLIIEDVKKRSVHNQKLRNTEQPDQIYALTEFLLTVRPDLPAVKDLLQTSKVFYNVFPKNNPGCLVGLTNLIHQHHFLAFYRGQKFEIDLRAQLFQFLLQKNVPQVKDHFKAIKLQTRMYLVTWFLSVFALSFKGQFLYRIWDNFLLQGQIYLFKVGMAIVKYYEIELKMCTFHQGLKLLKFPKQDTSPTLFFHILQNQLIVRKDYYEEYIQKRKHAKIKSKIQQIPLHQ